MNFSPLGRKVALSDRCFSVFDWEMTGAQREPGQDGRNWPGCGELSLRLADGVDFTNLAHRIQAQESIRRDGLLFGGTPIDPTVFDWDARIRSNLTEAV